VPWEYIEHTAEALRALQAQGYSIVVVEQTEASTDFRAATYPAKVAIVFGNEVGGVPKEICDAADMVVELPMHGEKESLNVSVAGGIILYHVAHA
jgi:tRNA G18 (ribose-2'-O)-methylase SpoU